MTGVNPPAGAPVMADDDGNEIVCPTCRHWPCSCSSPHPQERDIEPLILRMENYALRFVTAGKPQHADVIRRWIADIRRLRAPQSPREVQKENRDGDT